MKPGGNSMAGEFFQKKDLGSVSPPHSLSCIGFDFFNKLQNMFD
jgi:hypothetical protein